MNKHFRFRRLHRYVADFHDFRLLSFTTTWVDFNRFLVFSSPVGGLHFSVLFSIPRRYVTGSQENQPQSYVFLSKPKSGTFEVASVLCHSHQCVVICAPLLTMM